VHVLLTAKVFMVLRLSQPAPLARLLARRPTVRLGTVSLSGAGAWIAAKELLATQTSTSSGFDHWAQVLLGRIMPRSCPSPDGANLHAVIPIAVFMIIDAGTAS
jgi:hypothetical protein